MPRALRHVAAVAAATLCLTGLSPAVAALAPNYQRLAELRAILDHPGVTAAFGHEPIERVLYVRPDLYLVTAGRCRLPVVIASLPVPDGVVGARRFEVRPGRRACT